uniref:Uncharacterized protein n=1 Tax=Caenorhabditis japonica TaxID=281687 RepID=A0A8R1DYG1_CAEJA
MKNFLANPAKPIDTIPKSRDPHLERNNPSTPNRLMTSSTGHEETSKANRRVILKRTLQEMVHTSDVFEKIRPDLAVSLRSTPVDNQLCPHIVRTLSLSGDSLIAPRKRRHQTDVHPLMPKYAYAKLTRVETHHFIRRFIPQQEKPFSSPQTTSTKGSLQRISSYRCRFT